MKLELPDNNASVLFHMGNALQSIARDIDTSLPVNGHKITHAEAVGDVSCTIANEPSDTVEDVTNAVRASLEALLGRCHQQTTENLNTTGIEQYGKSVLSDCLDDIAAFTEVSDTIDADGLPWDQRINSKGRTRIKGDVWRARQKPNDKTDEEWAEYVEGVKTELRALMAIPVATGAELDVLANIPVITAEQRAELKVHVDYAEDPNEVDPFAVEPPVVEAPEVVTPPVVDAVVTPPVVGSATFEAVANGDIGAGQPVRIVAPPITDVAQIAVNGVVLSPVNEMPLADVDPFDANPVAVEAAVVAPPVEAAVVAPPVIDTVVTTGPTTFPELMKFITVNNKKLTKESVDEALKAQGLASIALLAARTDLIPQVHAALVKLL